MKIDTAEKYAERFRRIGNKRKPKERETDSDWACVPHHVRRVRAACQGKPNHGARAVPMDGVFALRPEKSKEWFPNVGGIRIVGSMGSCDRTLVAWSEEVNDANKPWKTEYFAYAYPCTVDHGWAHHKNDNRILGGLVRATGKPGEHRDSLGRTW